MSHSVTRSLRFFGVLFFVAVAGAACSVKGMQTGDINDGGADARGRDGGKGDVRNPDVADVRSAAGSSGGAGASGAGGAGGVFISFTYGAGTIATSSLASTTSSGGVGGTSTSSSSRTPDAGVRDARDAAGGTGGSSTKADAYVPDANRADTRDAPQGGSGGSISSGGAGGSGSRDAWVPDAPLPDAYVPDAPIDTPLGGSGGSGGSGGTGGTSSSSSALALRINSFNVSDGSVQATHITVTAGKSVTFLWDVSGATTKEIDREVGMVTGGSENITVPSPTEETTYTYTLKVTNSVNDASATYDSAHAEVKITVVPLAITSFAAEPTAVESGSSTMLTAFFAAGTDGTASINKEVGTVSSGVGKSVGPTEPTLYTLTVRNRLGDSIEADVWVNVLGLDAGAAPPP